MKKTFCRILAATLVASMMSNVYMPNRAYAETYEYKNEKSKSVEDKQWKLVWEDNFDGDSLNLEDWNYETHEPGWVNNELQEYTASTDNIFVKDGNLVLKAIQNKTENGVSYTSGKVTTQGKHDFKYGRFESRLKVPKGQGLWPAFWMMPRNEDLYGSWPRCGEIDIMEILGHETNKAYGTIHYGNPHKEQQGAYVLDEGSFADDYHVFAVEWEPNEMRFYIDGNLYHTVNDWYTKQEGMDEITYPAPFDQDFYLQYNLAVGGNWPGNPDETTNFDEAEYKVDYVKVYQLESYNENVSKPEKQPVNLREPDANGNYVNNGDFSKNEDLTDKLDWVLLNALGGKGDAVIKDNKITLTSEAEGKENYSLQLLQANIPLKQNGIYRLSFDAKAKEDRSMIVNVTSPDRGYVRQFEDTLVNLTNDKKTYSYEFTMLDDDDANARVEFNYGNQNSLAEIELTNVKLEKIGQAAPKKEEKTILPNGNYVYNGTFDMGTDRMKYWKVESKLDDANVTVTNTNNVRELKTAVNSKSSQLSDVILKEDNLGIGTNKEYCLSFDAYAEEDKTIVAQINGKTFEANLTKEKKNFKFNFTTGETLTNRDLEFLLGSFGVTYLDNVKLVEDSLIINGDFSNGNAKWEVFTDSSVTSQVSSNFDNNEAVVDIKNTGDADWKIQLKQTGVELVKGKKYKLSLDAKSSLGRKIKFAIQRDGSKDEQWTQYFEPKVIELGKEYNTYEVIFEMTEESDANSIFTISMGAIEDTQLDKEHMVSIDNVKLKEITDNGSTVINPEEKPGNDVVDNKPGDVVVDNKPGDAGDNQPGDVLDNDSDNSNNVEDNNQVNEDAETKLPSVKTGYESYALIITGALLLSGAALIFARPRRRKE